VSLSLRILASGSSGNCSVVRGPHGAMLIDAGLSPRATARRLENSGVTLDQIEAICLTHIDHDHFHSGWKSQAKKNDIRIFVAERQRPHLVSGEDSELAPLVKGIDFNAFEPVRGLCCQTTEMNHDELGSHAFVVTAGQTRLGFATDLGRVSQTLIDRFAGVDLLAIESNYCPVLQLQSNRPSYLKNRIMGGRGHLSNEQCFAAVKRILDLSQDRHRKLPTHVVLLHRSRECNCPRRVREVFHADPRLVDRLVLAEQDEPTAWLSPMQRPPFRGEQLYMPFPIHGEVVQ